MDRHPAFSSRGLIPVARCADILRPPAGFTLRLLVVAMSTFRPLVAAAIPEAVRRPVVAMSEAVRPQAAVALAPVMLGAVEDQPTTKLRRK